jgi:hypothetical protein
VCFTNIYEALYMQIAVKNAHATVVDFPPPSPKGRADRLAAILLEQRRNGGGEFPPGTYLFATLPNGSAICGLGRLRKLRPCAVTLQHY